jgi:hypothetical protein
VIEYGFSHTIIPRTHRAHNPWRVELRCMYVCTLHCILHHMLILISLQLYHCGYLHPLSNRAQATKLPSDLVQASEAARSEDGATSRCQRYQSTVQCDPQRCSRPKRAAASYRSIPAKLNILNHIVICKSNRRCSTSSCERS